MAVYNFKCIKCGYVEEKEIAMSDYDKEKENQKCSKCNEKMERSFDPIAAPIYEAHGFYCKP